MQDRNDMAANSAATNHHVAPLMDVVAPLQPPPAPALAADKKRYEDMTNDRDDDDLSTKTFSSNEVGSQYGVDSYISSTSKDPHQDASTRAPPSIGPPKIIVTQMTRESDDDKSTNKAITTMKPPSTGNMTSRKTVVGKRKAPDDESSRALRTCPRNTLSHEWSKAFITGNDGLQSEEDDDVDDEDDMDKEEEEEEGIDEECEKEVWHSPNAEKDCHLTDDKSCASPKKGKDGGIGMDMSDAETMDSQMVTHSSNKNRMASGKRKGMPKCSDDENVNFVGIGTVVYAIYKQKGDPADGRYFWGRVTRKKPTKPDGRSFKVWIEFFDGDKRKEVPREEYNTLAYMRSIFTNADLADLGALYDLIKEEVIEASCNICVICAEPPCSRCHSCRNGPSCFRQRMCQLLLIEQKALKAHGFPKGWRFAFHHHDQHAHGDPPIVMLSPDNRTYRSVERAINHYKVALAHVDPSTFYKYVGVKQEATVNGKAHLNASAHGAQNANEDSSESCVAVIASGLSNEMRAIMDKLKASCCGACDMCQKPACGICRVCKLHVTDDDLNVCLLKLCSQDKPLWIPLGQPDWDGWKFSVVPREDNGDRAAVPHLHPPSFSTRFQSPKGRCFGWATVFARRRDISRHKAAMLLHIYGIENSIKRDKHELIGQGFRREWINHEGRSSSIDGTVTECWLVGNDESFTIRWCGAAEDLPLPDLSCRENSREVQEGIERYRNYYSSAQKGTWLVPTNVRDGMSVSGRPSRTISCYGWRLAFQVAESEIDHDEAHLGCFMTCESESPATATLSSMVLPQGTFIDIGVYGRPEDSIVHQQFLCKNFIHSQKADKYTFGKKDGPDLFDVGDHLRTTLKQTAQANILPYVNETDGVEEPSVIGEYDPAGMLHYILGCTNKKFTLKKGKKVELKIDYEKFYEKTRIKNNYPRVRGEELARLQAEIDEEDPEFVKDCVSATHEVFEDNLAFVKTFVGELGRRGNIASEEARQRALFIASVSLARREFELDDDGKSLLRKLSSTLEPAAKIAMFDHVLFRGPLEQMFGITSGEQFLAMLDNVCSREE